MSMPLMIGAVAFVGVTLLVFAIGAVIRDVGGRSGMADRLDQLAGKGRKLQTLEQFKILRQNFDEAGGGFSKKVAQFVPTTARLETLIEQADVNVGPVGLLMLAAGLVVGGTVIPMALGRPWWMGMSMGLVAGVIPFLWLSHKRNTRVKRFAQQLPDALELVGRALRAGHSLATGMNVVAEEMPTPVAYEFGRVYEEQNLGISLDDSLESMCERIPNLDLKFFVTAVLIQRQTGGDLAEILDKIGYVVRERFKIQGQVQALTGEGRLSGVVLLALPVLLFVYVSYVNPDYINVLFEERDGRILLTVAVILQLLGAYVIKKIVNIKV